MFDLEATAIVSQLDSMPPGPDMAKALKKLDGKRLPLHDRLVVMGANLRMVRYYETLASRIEATIAKADLGEPRTKGRATGS